VPVMRSRSAEGANHHRSLSPVLVGFAPLVLDPDVDQSDAFDDAYFFVHAAFDHLPGMYRGGEGDDPATFRRLNLDGTAKLFETAKRAGVRRCVFLSSRAVYDGQGADSCLSEDLRLSPDTLYGEIKLMGEQVLADLSSPGFAGASLRLTGVYGNLRPNKWDDLLADYLAGRPVAPRAATEVHGRDVGQAVRLLLEAEASKVSGQSFNVSDIVTDRREILSTYQRATGLPASAAGPGGQECGWRNGNRQDPRARMEAGRTGTARGYDKVPG